MNSYNLVSSLKINLKKKKIILLQKKTKNLIEILNVLWDEKLIYGYCIFKDKFVKIYLKFNKLSISFIKNIRIISTPGRSIYMSMKSISYLVSKHKNIFPIFSSSKGILSAKKALQLHSGGRLLFIVYI